MAGDKEITNSEDWFDSRDVIARIETLKAIPKKERDEWERAELRSLKALAEEAGGYSSEWQYGMLFIRDSHFEDYAEQYAEEIGAISSDYQWPLSHIDWGAAADALQMDYTSYDFDGVTYWARS